MRTIAFYLSGLLSVIVRASPLNIIASQTQWEKTIMKRSKFAFAMSGVTNTPLFVLFAGLTHGIIFGELKTTQAQDSGEPSVTAYIVL